MTVGGLTGWRLIGCATALAVLSAAGCGGGSDDGARVDELREEIRHANEQLDDLEGTRPEPADDSTTTTEILVVDAADWDYANATLPPEVCQRLHGTSIGVTLSDGSAQVVGAGTTFVDLVGVETGDLTGDGAEEAIVEISCSAGAEPSITGEVVVFESAPGSPRLLAHLAAPVTTIGAPGVADAGIESADGDLTVVWGLRGSFMSMGFLPNLLTERLHWDGAQLVVEESSTSPAVDFDQLGSIEDGDPVTWEGYLCSTFEDFVATAGWRKGSPDLYIHADLVGGEIRLLVTDFESTWTSIMTRDGYEPTDPEAWKDSDLWGVAWTEPDVSTCSEPLYLD